MNLINDKKRVKNSACFISKPTAYSNYKFIKSDQKLAVCNSSQPRLAKNDSVIQM